MTRLYTLHKERDGVRQQVCELRFDEPSPDDPLTPTHEQIMGFIAEMVDDMDCHGAWNEGWDAVLVAPTGTFLLASDWEPYDAQS